ncbi:MAG: response regulator [Proteobacteria bacterium]|nr:response regulator [Pseudomonadota bacterium]
MALREPSIFVVDDDEPVRDSTTALLESHGLPVNAFASATAFLDAEIIQHGDCLILDNHMPGMTGVELVETLRARGIRVPVIMFTGRADAALKQRAMSAGVLIVLDKPVTEEHLLQAISIARLSANDIH